MSKKTIGEKIGGVVDSVIHPGDASKDDSSAPESSAPAKEVPAPEEKPKRVREGMQFPDEIAGEVAE